MSPTVRRRSVLGLLFLLVVAVGLWAATDGVAAGPATVEVVAKDMAFKLPPGSAEAAAALKPGSRVRVVFANDDTGIVHDLSIGASLSTGPIAPGETATLVFVVPAKPTIEFHCALHARMMKGEFVVDG